MFRKIRAKLIKTLGGYVDMPAPGKTPTIRTGNIEKLCAVVSLGKQVNLQDPLTMPFAKAEIADKITQQMLATGIISFEHKEDMTGETNGWIVGTVYVAENGYKAQGGKKAVTNNG